MTALNYIISFIGMVIIPCVTVPQNWEYCAKDWDVWLYPEIQRGFDMLTEKELPYQDERELLETYK